MRLSTDAAGAPPAAIRTLIDRWDGAAFEAPEHRARIRLIVGGEGEWDVLLDASGVWLATSPSVVPPDATLAADRAVWDRLVENVRGGMDAYRAGGLVIRRNLHLGVGFLAATSGARGPGRLRFRRMETDSATLSILSAGSGPPVVCIHGLGATKGSFLPTVAALADRFTTISLDLPGFGDSTKPILAPYHAPFFARAVVDLLNAMGIERTHLVGNSMGGRVALELGLRHPDRVGKIVLLAPSLAWRRQRPWAPLVRLLRPELGLLQLAPRWAVERFVRGLIPGADASWVQAGVDEFLRSYLTPRGRAAFYAAARQIYLEEPHGAKGLWTRLATMTPPCLFVWGRRDTLVPIGFAPHVRRVLPAARQLELDCGHVPQLERPAETHAAIAEFLLQAATVSVSLRHDRGEPMHG
jgi:pimeloyl-ACP methyl ester carboxylesterase